MLIQIKTFSGVQWCIRMDGGTENGHIEDMQKVFRWKDDDAMARQKSVITGSSTKNQVPIGIAWLPKKIVWSDSYNLLIYAELQNGTQVIPGKWHHMNRPNIQEVTVWLLQRSWDTGIFHMWKSNSCVSFFLTWEGLTAQQQKCTEENVIAIFVCILVTLNKFHVYFIFLFLFFFTENASDFALWELYRKNLIKLNMSGITILSEFSKEIL